MHAHRHTAPGPRWPTETAGGGGGLLTKLADWPAATAATPTCGCQQPAPSQAVAGVGSQIQFPRQHLPSFPRPIFTCRGSCPCLLPLPSCRLVHGRAAPALSPPPSPPPSLPCPHLIAPLILAPLRNRLDDVPFRLNFFLGGLADCTLLHSIKPAGQQPVKQAHATTRTHTDSCRPSPFCPLTQATQANQTPATQSLSALIQFSPERGRRQIPISFLGPSSGPSTRHQPRLAHHQRTPSSNIVIKSLVSIGVRVFLFFFPLVASFSL